MACPWKLPNWSPCKASRSFGQVGRPCFPVGSPIDTRIAKTIQYGNPIRCIRPSEPRFVQHWVGLIKVSKLAKSISTLKDQELPERTQEDTRRCLSNYFPQGCSYDQSLTPTSFNSVAGPCLDSRLPSDQSGSCMTT